MTPDILQQLKTYAEPQARPTLSQWHRNRTLDLYLRTGPYQINPATWQRELAIGISNVAVPPCYRQKKVFSDLVRWLELQGTAHGYKWLLVEQVHTEFLAAWLFRNGFDSNGEDFGPTFRKRLQP